MKHCIKCVQENEGYAREGCLMKLQNAGGAESTNKNIIRKLS